jgi:hypothetical protein
MKSLRNHIDLVESAMTEPLFEMPVLHTKPEDFGLNDPAVNHSEYQRLAETDYHVIEENANFLFAYALNVNLEFFVLNLRDRALVYYVEATPLVVPKLGNCATQVVLWRRAGAGMPSITTRVFYDELLGKFDSVISDKCQTYDGRRFWIDRMAESAQKGFTVGFLNEKNIASIYDPSMPIQEWLTANNGWGENQSFDAYRYFVTKKKLPPTS